MVQVVAGAYVEDLEPAILILSGGGLEGAAADGKLRTPYNTGHHTLSFEQPRLIESARRSSSTSGSPSRGRRDTIGHLGGSVQAVIRRSVAVPSINRRMQCFAMPAGKRYNRSVGLWVKVVTCSVPTPKVDWHQIALSLTQ
jgi:hypothetical protein